MQVSKYIESLSKLAPALIFGVIFLYWEGYIFLITYLQQFSISVTLSDFSFQDILLTGISPFLIGMLWLSKHLLVFDFLKNWAVTSPTAGIVLDWVVFSASILIGLILCRVAISMKNNYLDGDSKWKSIIRVSLYVFSSVFILFFIPRWSAIEGSKLGYQVISSSYSIKVVYSPPALVPEDVCNEENCIGDYIKILDARDYLYLNPKNKCLTREKVGYNFDSGPRGEKIITNPIYKEEHVCNSLAVPKNRILQIINLP